MIGAGLVSAGPTDRQTIYTAASLDQPLDHWDSIKCRSIDRKQQITERIEFLDRFYRGKIGEISTIFSSRYAHNQPNIFTSLLFVTAKKSTFLRLFFFLSEKT